MSFLGDSSGAQAINFFVKCMVSMNGANATSSVLERALVSVKWSALMEVVSRTAAPIVTVVLARFLTPADFGVVATVMIVTSFSQLFWDAGLSKALVQVSEAPEEAANAVFWINSAMGLAAYVLLFLAAPWLSAFFRSPPVEPVLRVLGLQTVIASLSSVQQSLLVRDLDFRRLFYVRLLATCIPGAFSIPMAMFGLGVWALVVGSLAGQSLSLVLLWKFSHWRPTFRCSLRIGRRLLGFGAWVAAEGLGAWLIVWGDTLIVGKFLGTSDLGLYRTGWLLATIAFGAVLNPLLPILYPAFTRLRDDPRVLVANFRRATRVVISLSLPMGVGLYLLGPDVATVLFGRNWEGLGVVLSVIGLMHGFAWLTGINPELYRAMGRPDVNSKLLFCTLLYYLPVYIIAAQSGLGTFVHARLGVAIIAVPLHVYITRRVLRVPLLYLWHDGKSFILATIAMGTSIEVFRLGIDSVIGALPEAIRLGLLVLVGMCTYAASLWVLDRPFLLQTTRHAVRAATS